MKLFTKNGVLFKSVRRSENGLERVFVKHWFKLRLNNWPKQFDSGPVALFWVKIWKFLYDCFFFFGLIEW